MPNSAAAISDVVLQFRTLLEWGRKSVAEELPVECRLSLEIRGQLTSLLDLSRRLHTLVIYGDWWPRLQRAKAGDFLADVRGILTLIDQIHKEIQYFLDADC